MANKTINTRIVLKNDSKANWITNNPVLRKSEFGIEFDPNATANNYKVNFKIGDGIHNWSDLPYQIPDPVTLPAPDGTTIVDDNGTWKLAGFDAATANSFPVKNASGEIVWTALPEHFADIDTMYTTISGLGTASTKNVAATGDATANEVVMGNDSRLTNARNAADVYDWAKAATKPAYDADEVGAVSIVANQGLTAEQKAAARANIDVLGTDTLYGADIGLTIDDQTYVITVTLKDQNGDTLGTAKTIDLPLESVVVSGSYDAATKKVILTLKNGSTVEFSVADLISGLQSEITSANKLDADLVDDTNAVNKFVTAADKTKLAGIDDGAEVNVVESVSTADGALPVTDKGVTIPTASTSAQGTVKSTTVNNGVAVGNDGVMTVNDITTDKLVQGVDTLIFDCGDSSN